MTREQRYQRVLEDIDELITSSPDRAERAQLDLIYMEVRLLTEELEEVA